MVDLDTACPGWYQSETFWDWLDTTVELSLFASTRKQCQQMYWRDNYSHCNRKLGHTGPHASFEHGIGRTWYVWGEDEEMAPIVVMARLLK